MYHHRMSEIATMFNSLRNQDVTVLDARPVSVEMLSPTQYVALSDAERAKIRVVDIVAPRLGSNSFGGVLVRHSSPVYKVFK